MQHVWLKFFFIINGIAKGETKLIENYNKQITKEKTQNQYLPQVLYDYQKEYADFIKGT